MGFDFTLLVIAVVFGPLVGVALLYLGAWLVELSCRLLRGEADSKEVRSALAWSSVPILATIPLWILRIALLGRELFTFDKPSYFSSPILRNVVIASTVPELVLSVWWMVVTVKALAEVQRFLGLEGVQLDAIADRASDDSHCDPGNWSRLSSDRSCSTKTKPIEKRPLMTEKSNLAAELEFTKSLATEAAQVARRRCRHVTPQEKANLSYVTDLDHDLETMIRERLAAQFPDDALSGEEYADSGGKGPRRWSIDPIDGTGNLVHGLPLWSVSIGLIVSGEPMLGVIVIPQLDELFWAVRGEAHWLGDEQTSRPGRRDLSRPG